MARTAKELKKLSKQGYFIDNEQDEYDDYGYQDAGVNLDDFIERNNNAPIDSTTTGSASSDVSNPDTFLKFTEALDKASQARNNPFTNFGIIGESIAKGISLLDPNGDKALLTTEQKINYANNNIANLSDENKNKLNEYNNILDELDASRMSLTDNFNPEENERFAANSQRLKDLKASLQQDLNLDDETFNKYVSSSKFLKNLEDRQRQQEEYANASAGEKALANIGDTLLAPIRPYVTLKGYLDEKGNPYYDENLGVDHNATGFDMANMNRDITTQATKDIEELAGANEEDASLGSKAANEVLKTLYTGVKSGADSMARLATGEVSTLLGAGLEAADQQYVDAGERGLTKAQAIGTALSSGAAEVVFEKIPLDNMLKLWKNGAEGVAKGGVKAAVKEILQQAGLEGMEEVETDIANKFSDAIINKDKSEFNTQVEEYKAQGMDEKEAFGRTLLDNVADTVESFAGGAIGGLVGAGGAIAGSVATTKEAKKLDGNYREVAQAIPDNVEAYNSKEDYNKAMEVKARAEELDTQDKVSSADSSELLQDIYAVNETMPNVDLIENINESVNSPFADVGGFQVAKNDITSQEVAQSMAQASQDNNINDFVEAYRDSQASSDAEARQTGQQYFNTLSPKFYTYDEGSRLLDDAMSENTADELYTMALNGEEVAPELLNTQRKADYYNQGAERRSNLIELQNQLQEQRKAQELKEKESIGQTKIKKVETPQGKADIADISINNDGSFVWKKGDEEVVIPKKDISDKAMQQYMEYATSQPTLRAKQLYADNYTGSMPIGNYNMAFTQAFNAGRGNSYRTFKQFNDAKPYFSEQIPVETLEAFYNEGKRLHEEENKKSTVNKDRRGKSVERKGTGKVTYDKSIDKNDPIVKKAELTAELTGLDVEIVDGDIYEERNGEKVKVKGQFKPNLSKIIISKNTRVNETLDHEGIGEYMEAYNPEDMKEIQDLLLNYLFETNASELQEEIDKMHDLYRKVNPDTSMRDAANEVVNNALSGVFSSEEGIQKLADYAYKNNQQSAFEKLVQFIKDLVNKIKSLVDNEGLNKQAQRVAKMEQQRLEELQDKILNALTKARQNYENTSVEGATEDMAASLDSTAYSLVVPLNETFLSNKEKERVKRDTEKLSEQLDNWMQGEMTEKGYFEFGKTSEFLKNMKKLRIPNLKITMDENSILKFTTDYKDHSVAIDDIKALPAEFADPLIVLKGNVPNSIVIVTGIQDKAGDQVIVALHYNRKQGRIRVNRIASVYGKGNIANYINKQVELGNYIDGDKKRSASWTTISWLQLPSMVQSNQRTSNNSIPSSQENATTTSSGDTRNSLDIDEELDSMDIDIDLLNEWFASDEPTKTENKEAVKFGKGYDFVESGNKKLAYTEDRINYLLDSYAASNTDYAQAYVAYINPIDFLKLTTGANQRAMERIEREGKKLDLEELQEETQPLFLNIDEEDSEVIGHEGRHRMYALYKEGYTSVPILLFNYQNKYSKQNIDSIDLLPQWFSEKDDNISDRITVTNLMPFSRGNEEEIREQYGKGTSADARFSLDVDSEEIDKAYNEAIEDNDTDKLETMVLGAARANGYAYEAYHGTMNGGFFEFRKEKAKVGGNSGAGFYFSSNPYDSENNYEDVEGADNYFKWEELAEQIEEEGEYNGEVVEDHDRAVEIAKEVLNANPMTYHVYLKIENPFIRNYDNSTNIIDDIMEDYDEDRVDRDDYDSEDEYEEELYRDRDDFLYEYIEDSVWAAYRDLEDNYSEVDIYPGAEKIIQNIFSNIWDYQRLNFEDIVEAIGYDVSIFDDSWTSNNVAEGSHEFARAIIENLGYDAIIDYEVSSKFNQLKDMDDDTTHYIMFNPNHVKSADNIVYDDNGNIVPLSERFDDSKSDIRYSLEDKSDAEIDQEYMNAVEAEDMATLNRMVREYASMKGFNSPKVYHGTNKFGFTEFQKAKLDDKNSIFVAEDRKIASSYVGNIQDNTPISSGVTADVWDMDNSTLIKYAQKYLDSDYRMATEKEVQEDLDFSRNQISKAKDNFVKGIKDIDNLSSEDNEIAKDFIKALDVASSTNSRKEFLEANHTINMGRYDARSDEMADLIDDVLTMRVNMALDNLLQKVDIDVDNFVTRNGLELEWTNALITELEGVLKHGIYELYGKEDNLFELDAEGANWNRIKTSQEMIDAGYRVDDVRTREISKYAREQGYNGVRILNVKDSGGKVEGAHYPSNIRIYFDSSSLKSADPITYDDNGDVIPLSERFNTDNEDIRYSLDVPTTYALDDYDPFIDDDVTETKDSKEAFTNSIIKAANDVLNFNISDKQVSDIADKMISDYSSTVDKEFVTKNLRNIFSAMNSDNIQDMTNALINLSEEVVRQSEEIDPDEQANYDDFIKNMPKIKLSEEQKNEAINRMGDWNTVFGAMGRFLSNDTTTTLDGNVYWQICDNALEHNYVMDRDANDADQLMNIIEAVENMRPQSRAIFEGGDITDAALVTANEIMQQYYGYALKDAQANANLKEVKADLKKQVDDYKRVIGKQYQERVNELNKQLKSKDNEIKQLRAFNTSEISKAISIEKARLATAEKNARADKTNLNKYIERQERNKYLKSIRNQAIRTIKMLENPTRNKFIPEVLQKPTIEMLQTFDFVTYRVRKNGELVPWGEEKGGEPTKTNKMWREKMEALQRVLNNLEGIQEEEDLSKYGNNSSYLYNLSVELGDVTKGLLDQFLQDTQKDSVKISTLNSEKLKVLDKFMKSYLASINGAQEAMIDGNNVQLAQVGQQVASEISGLKSVNAVAGTIKKKILDFLNLDMAEPITVFSELGGTMEKLYWHLEQGKDVRDGHIFATEDAFSKAKEELNIDKNEPSKWETGLMSFKDGQLQLTPAQVMSLYAAYGRSQARHHIIFGGVMSSDEGLRGKDKKLKKVQTKPVHLTPKDVEEIVNTLTPQQKALADFMVDYMSNEVSDWGNRVSQKRWGIRLFTESHYFPIKTFDVTRPSRTMDENANASLFSLQNQGFTKPLQKDANNALVLEDIFKVFSDHVAKMAAYDGYVIPINDFMRVFNYAESQETFVVKQGEEGQYRTDASVKEQIQRVFGTKGTQYFTKFIKNVNEDFGEGGSINLIDKLFSNNKAQAVLANGRVVIQQPTAYPRAMEVIDGKYLVKALSTSAVGLKKKIQRSKSHNTLAKFKSKGYYETSIGQSMQQMITGTATPKDKVNEVAGALAGLADDITWSVIYQAAEYKVQAEQKKLKVDSKEYFDAVNKIANEAFIKTQVVDSVFTKSQMMRSRDTGDKMLTAFMAEPTKYYNMLHRGVFNMYQTGNKKAFAKAVYLFVVGQVINSVAQSAYDAWRDDDDEKDAMEKFLNALLGISDIQEANGVWATMQAILKANLVENLLPINLLPVVKEVNSALAGWDSKNMSTQAIYDIVGDAKKIVDWAEGKGTLTTYGVLNTVAHSLSLATGMPVSSALREVKDLYNHVNDLWDGTNLVKNEQHESAKAQIAKSENIQETVKTLYQKKVQENLEKGKTQKEAEKAAKSSVGSAITGAYKNDLVELTKTNMSEATSMKAEAIKGFTALGISQADANKRVEKWFK